MGRFFRDAIRRGCLIFYQAVAYSLTFVLSLYECKIRNENKKPAVKSRHLPIP